MQAYERRLHLRARYRSRIMQDTVSMIISERYFFVQKSSL